MSLEEKNTDLLPEIDEDQMNIYAEEILYSRDGCVSFGPFKLCADVKLDPPSAKITLSYHDRQLAVCDVSESHPDCEAKWGNSHVKVDVKFKLDMAGKKITATGKACIHISHLGWKCMSRTITVYSW